jgi:hypothetical protein
MQPSLTIVVLAGIYSDALFDPPKSFFLTLWPRADAFQRADVFRCLKWILILDLVRWIGPNGIKQCFAVKEKRGFFFNRYI